MLILIIKIYRTYFKSKLLKTCLFKTSCSRFVEQELSTKGNLAGWKALWRRIQDCQPGYKFAKSNGDFVLIAKSGKIYYPEELSPITRQELELFSAKE